jgi:hypothetical protein
MIDWLSIILWVVGTFGIVGTIVLYFAAPALFSVLMEALQKIFGAILSTRVGCAILAAIAAAILADQYREHVAVAQCSAEIVARDKRADRLAVQRDTDQSVIAGDDAIGRLADLNKQASQDQETVNALHAADQACHPITADQLR